MNTSQASTSSRQGASRDAVGLIVALLSLMVALAVLGILRLLRLPDDAVIVTCLLLLPLFVYLIVSRRLTELTAPGGWTAKFVQTARESLRSPSLIPPRPITVQKEYQKPCESELRQGPNSLKVVMEAEPIEFPICGYLDYVHKNLASGDVRYILVFDGPKTFYALLPMASISTDRRFYPAEGQCKAYELIDWLYQKDLDQLARLNGFVASEDAASLDWSKQRCFREMVERKLEALPVVRDAQLIGIVERTQLATSVIVDLLDKFDD